MKIKKIITIVLAIMLCIPIVVLSILGGIFTLLLLTIDVKDIDISCALKNREELKEIEHDIRSKSGIIFSSNVLFDNGIYHKYRNKNGNWNYISKESFKLPENLDSLKITTLENQTYDLTLGGVGNLCWRSDEKPFKLPVDLDELYLQNNLGFANKEALVSRVKELEAKGEEWVAESDLELDEKMFSCYFKTNIVGATESWSANWITNNFAFEAQILKTPEKYYLHLWSREALPSKLEALKAKEVAVE